MNENGPTNQEDGVDMSYVEMAQGTPSVRDTLRAAKESGDPQVVAQAEALADEKYLLTQESSEEKIAAMKIQTEKAISDLISYLNETSATDPNKVETLVGNVANDFDSIKTLRIKGGEQGATVANEVSNFAQLDDPLLAPLKEALLAYGENSYGVPVEAARQLAERHRQLINRTRAESMGI